MVLRILWCLLLVTGISCINVDLRAQQSKDGYGKNRVQYKSFNWQFYSSDNFDVYFYEGGKQNARKAAEYLEGEYDRITQDVLGYALYSKAKIFIYNSVSDLQQSNIGINNKDFTSSGQTDFVKPQVEVANPGNAVAFKRELIFQVSKLLIRDMMYGGSLTEMFQSSYLFNLPEWVIEGGALYITEGWSVEMDDYMRDYFSTRKFKKLGKLGGKEAGIVGQSIWNYIAENYGMNNISNILNLTRINRSEQNSIIYTLGVTYDRFIEEWKSYYINMSDQVNASYQQPSEGFAILGDNKKGLIYHNANISPNGAVLSYTTNFNGKYEVRIRDLTSGHEESVLKGGYKVINQEVDEEIPLLSWKDNNTLGIVNVVKGEYQLIIYDIGSGRSQKRSLGKITQVKDLQFHENGKTAIVSADSRGQNDLFLLSLAKNSLRRITNDTHDDLNPRFIPGTNNIVFTSNRTNDTINRETVKLKDIESNFNLFLMNLDSVSTVLTRITNTLSHDIQPLPQDSSVIYYISDQKGIYNLYRYELETKLYTQVSKFSKSIKQYDINFKKGSMVYITTNAGQDQIYYQGSYNLNENNFTPLTRRQEVQQALFISERIRQRRERELEQLEVEQQEDTFQIELVQPADTLELEEEVTGAIDTDNYVFDTEVLEEVEKETEEPQSILQNFRAMARESEINGPFNYEPRVGFDNIIFSWIIDPLIGFGIEAEVTVNDLLENHKFYGGVLATTDLRSGSYYGEYHFLKDRLDYHAGFSRRTLFRSINDPIADYDIKYIMNRFEVGASYPINIRSRIRVSPFYTATRSYDLDPTKLSFPPGTPGLPEPADTQRDYIGGRLEYVYDNTVVNGLNFEGTRLKAFFEHYESFNDSELNFNTFKIDVRHYHKIHRELTFAGRLFYARSFGNDPKDFLLGGMSNWLFNDTDNENNEGDPLFDPVDEDNSNILFVEYVTNMRGFDYNKFSGNNALLFNAELRFPIIKFFNSGPIASNFFRNLQLIGFYDLGSAWTGNSPLADENSLNTETIEAGNFKARINNFGSAWLASYGTGVRTVLLGYYLKFDVAWPIEDYEVGSPKFYLTLGYDF
jgi:hypothetical protein